MHVTNYHVHNVLRAYGKQLSHNKRGARNNQVVPESRTDSITISTQARRTAVIDKVTSDIVERIVRTGPRDLMEQEAFEELESEFGSDLAMEEGGDTEFVFKVIDKEKGDEIKTLSVEDSKILKDRLKEIIQMNASSTAKEIITSIYDALNEFRGAKQPEDDITMVVIKVQR